MHIFIGIRSIIGENKTLENNIKKLLVDEISYDIDVQYPKNETEIKKKLQYCFKEIETNNGLLACVEEQFEYWAELSDWLESSHTILTNVKKIEEMEGKYNVKEIKGVQSNKEEEIVVNMWLYYLILNNMYLYRGDIFKKIDNTSISFIKITAITSLIDNFIEFVFTFFLKNFPLHFFEYPIEGVIKKMLFFKSLKIENLENITTNKIKINYTLMEFKDGIYDIKNNKFLPKNSELKVNNIGTVKYYNKTYKNLQEPKKWLDELYKVVENDQEKVNWICIYIANIFHRSNAVFKDIFKKKKTLYIEGESNTKKTTLIAKPIISYFGAENVGFINKEGNFKWENMKEKIVAIWDEFKYDKNMRDDLLKLLNEENLLIPAKYKKAHLLEQTPAIIIISNKYIDEIENDPLILKAFENRIQKIVFKRSYSDKNEKNVNENLEEFLKKEEANIIIHCNKLLHRHSLKKTRITYKKLQKLIETNQEK